MLDVESDDTAAGAGSGVEAGPEFTSLPTLTCRAPVACVALALCPAAGTLVLAAGCTDGSVHVHHGCEGGVITAATTLQHAKALRGHNVPVTSVALLPGRASVDPGTLGLLLASGSADSTVRVWDLRRGEVLWVLRGRSQALDTRGAVLTGCVGLDAHAAALLAHFRGDVGPGAASPDGVVAVAGEPRSSGRVHHPGKLEGFVATYSCCGLPVNHPGCTEVEFNRKRPRAIHFYAMPGPTTERVPSVPADPSWHALVQGLNLEARCGNMRECAAARGEHLVVAQVGMRPSTWNLSEGMLDRLCPACKGPLNPNFFTAVLAFECKWWFKGRMVVPHTRKGHLVETAGVAVDQPQRLLEDQEWLFLELTAHPLSAMT